MKLSEAIRLGALLKPQAIGPGWPERSCALEAAADAIGESQYLTIQLHWPWLKGLSPCCPHQFSRFLFWRRPCGWRPHSTFGERIFHLNDVHEWSREQIAEWVATVEPQEANDESPLYRVTHPYCATEAMDSEHVGSAL